MLCLEYQHEDSTASMQSLPHLNPTPLDSAIELYTNPYPGYRHSIQSVKINFHDKLVNEIKWCSNHV